MNPDHIGSLVILAAVIAFCIACPLAYRNERRNR